MDEQNNPGRCRWAALGLMVFLFQGLLPANFMGGTAGLEAARKFVQGSSEIISRIFVLAGMIISLMISAMMMMLLMETIKRVFVVLFDRPGKACSSMRRARGVSIP